MNDQERITKLEAEKANLISGLGSETMRVAKLEHQLQAVEKDLQRFIEAESGAKVELAAMRERLQAVEKERDRYKTALDIAKELLHFRPHPREWWDYTMNPESEKRYETAMEAWKALQKDAQ